LIHNVIKIQSTQGDLKCHNKNDNYTPLIAIFQQNLTEPVPDCLDFIGAKVDGGGEW